MHSINTATGAMDPLRNSRCRRCFCSRFPVSFQPVRICRRGCGAGNASSGNRGNETCRHGEKPQGYRSSIQHHSCRNTLGNHIRFRPGRPSRPRSWWAVGRGTMIVCLWWLKPIPFYPEHFDAARNSPTSLPRFSTGSHTDRTRCLQDAWAPLQAAPIRPESANEPQRRFQGLLPDSSGCNPGTARVPSK